MKKLDGSRQRPSNGAALHLRKWSNLERLKDRGRDVIQPQPLKRRGARTAAKILAVRHQENAIPIVISAVWTRVVFLALCFTADNHPARPPIEIAKKDTEIGGNVPRVAIDLF